LQPVRLIAKRAIKRTAPKGWFRLLTPKDEL
jgi:hypothetical protein